ncbi:MAG: hypothetical protein IJ364_06055 [Oscillospiraceae bacterium]|nr:hypothetical protein [Oscillospiraceae bacterium]
MIIEILFSKYCNLFGDSKNIEYIKLSLPEAEYKMTEITDEKPYFAEHDVDMIYLGGMTEKGQKRVLDWLRPYKARIEELIAQNVVFLITGNAFEVFAKSIYNKTSKETIEGLGVFDLKTEIDLFDRFHSKCTGMLEDIQIVGFRSQFSRVYGDNSKEYFLQCDRGFGINKDTVFEGVRRNNFMGTHLLGPILVLNPLFMEYIMKLLGVNAPKAAFREEAMAAYEQRLSEFNDEKIKF